MLITSKQGMGGQARRKKAKVRVKTITLAEATKLEKQMRRQFLEFIRGLMITDLGILYENNLGTSLVAYGRITAYRDILRRIEDVTGDEIVVDFMVRIGDSNIE